MTCDWPELWLILLVLAGCRSPTPSTLRADRVEPRSAAPAASACASAAGQPDAGERRTVVSIEHESDVGRDSDAGSEQPVRAGCKGKSIRLPRSWEDAYTLSRKAVADGTPTTAVGRVREINDDVASLDAVCRPYGTELLVTFAKPPCGVVGDTLVVRGVARAPDPMTTLGPADGPAVTLVDAVVLGTTTTQEVCRARQPR